MYKDVLIIIIIIIIIDYLQDITDDFLDENPKCVVVLGGDLDKLNVDILATKLGFDALVNFPTRGNNILDNVLTNCPSLFHSCYAVDAALKTYHKGVVLPPVNKRKTVRMEQEFRDRSEHRKLELYGRMYKWKIGVMYYLRTVATLRLLNLIILYYG